MSIDTSSEQTSMLNNLNQNNLDQNSFDNSSVVIALLVGIDKHASPIVSYPFITHCKPQLANTTVQLSESDIGRQVAILFAQGNQDKPLIIGKLFNPKIDKRTNQKIDLVTTTAEKPTANHIEISSDDQQTEIIAKNKIKLTCGRSSITLTQEGKVLIEGEYILTQSTGPNKIKGASIQLN